MFLTTDQIQNLTGRKIRCKQCAELNAMGIRFKVTLAGYPKVLKSEVERVMLGGSKSKTASPNFDLING